LITFTLLCIPAFGQTTAVDTNQTYNPLELTDKNMASALNDSSFLVLDFYSPGCDPCKSMNKTTSELSNELQGQIKFGRVNGDTTRKYNITTYPTLLFFDKGILVNRIEGYSSNSKSDLLADLKKFRPELDTSKVQLPGDWDNKGNALYEQGKYDEAIKAYDEAIKLDPNDANAWYNKGVALDQHDKNDEAIQAYDRAIEIDPQYTEAWTLKGIALDDQGKYELAILAFDKVIELNPEYSMAWNNKGYALVLQGKYAEAIQAFNKSIELDPNNADAWDSKGEALRRQGKYEEAIQALDKAIELDPNLADAWNNKSEALKALGKTTEANDAFAKAKELGYKD
jgi:tetratricopeptide (TPR) repeat protein